MSGQVQPSRLPKTQDSRSAAKKSKLPSPSASTPSHSIFSRKKKTVPIAQENTQPTDSLQERQPSRKHGSQSTGVPVQTTQEPIPSQAMSQTTRFGFKSKPVRPLSPETSSDAKPNRKVLRRKPSSINQRSVDPPRTIGHKPMDSTILDSQTQLELFPSSNASLSSGPHGFAYTDQFSSRSQTSPHPNQTSDISYGLAPDMSSFHLPAPSSFHPGASISPSTRQSESPSPWSRTSTPTSMSSHSPGMTMPSKFQQKVRHVSPTRSRPPVTRRRAGSFKQDEKAGTVDAHGLPSLRESVTSSSSSASTLRVGDKKEKLVSSDSVKKSKKKKTQLSPPPPSPPPRKSSHKFGKSPSSKIHTQQSPKSTYETPKRPSRDGTPDLSEPGTAISPVVQSNLLTLQEGSLRWKNEGTRDAERMMDLNSPYRGPFGTLGDRPLSRGLLSRTVSPTTEEPRTQGASSHLPVSTESKKSSKSEQNRLQSIKSKPSTSRFGIFTRRNKGSSDRDGQAKPEKSTKKGPTAGTGHEGYGKYAARGRSGSQTGGSQSKSRNRSRSNASTAAGSIKNVPSLNGSVTSRSDLEVDEFFRDRLEPVVISGGATPAGSLFGAEMSRTGSNQSSQDRPSFDSKINSSQVSVNSKRSQDQQRSAFGFFGTSRRSPSALSSRRPSTGSESEDFPKKPSLAMRRSLHRSQILPNKETLSVPKPIDSSLAAASSTVGEDAMQSTAVPLTASSFRSGTDVSEGKEGNWLKPKNMDQQGKSLRKWNFFQRSHQKSNTKVTEVSAAVAHHHQLRPIAHYALMDSTDQDGLESIQGGTGETKDLDLLDSPKALDSDSDSLRDRERQTVPSMLLPEPPVIPQGFNQSRPISPRIELRSNERYTASGSHQQGSEMFPIKASRLPQVGRIPRVVSTKKNPHGEQSVARAFPLVVKGQESNSRRESSTTQGGDRPTPKRSNTGDSSTGPFDPRSFLAFPPRKGSIVSCSSSSGAASIEATVAIIPEPDEDPAEDEIWNEYDDLIDVLSPDAPRVHPRRVKEQSIDHQRDAQPPKLDKHPSALFRSSHGQGLPNTPLSLTDFFAGYGERNLNARESTMTHFSMSDISRLSSASNYSRPEIEPQAELEKARNSKQAGEQSDSGSKAQVNVRFGALMTSKWLSFGRVLFSPAHNELNQAGSQHRQDRVLILDGLGNDDWSYYCALTYPDAIIYNITTTIRPSQSNPKSNRDSGAWKPPPNHRQIHHSDMENPFPFPRGFFTAAVLRFPTISSDLIYKMMVAECKRVLRPGGFLEISVLDLDMMNMGTRTRRALMNLKVKMQHADDTISLKPTSDNIQRMLGRRGFENLNRCMVGVPAAGSLSESRSSSMDEKSVSLSALLNNQSQKGDEDITNMVARVGRWWYTKCFENGILADGDASGSIWYDKILLKECERNKTSFKLLICYAQKPLLPRRRTVSV